MYFYRQDSTYADRIYPNVYINGEDFGGENEEGVEAYFAPLNEKLSQLSFEVAYQDSIATFSGEMIGLHYNTANIVEQAFLIGRSPHTPSAFLQQISTLFNLNSYAFDYMPMYSFDPIKDYLTELEGTYNIPAQNALFEFEEGRVTTFKVEEDGKMVDIKATTEAISSYLMSDAVIKGVPRKFIVEDTILEPDISIVDTNEFGIVEKIGEGQSDYTGSSAEREHNVVLAASKFHGVLIPPGEVFSYNDTVGDISVSTGYKTSLVIKDGRTVLGDGGGVCQDSTTLFRAALNTGLPIVERRAHSYRVKYYENDRKPGFDATVYGPTVDFKFRNDTDAYILIQSDVDQVNNILRFEFYGKSDGRKVELSDASVYGYQPAPEPLYIDDPTLPRGVTKQVDWAAPGAKSSFTYKVIQADGEVTEDRTFYSAYRPWQAVYQVGVR